MKQEIKSFRKLVSSYGLVAVPLGLPRGFPAGFPGGFFAGVFCFDFGLPLPRFWGDSFVFLPSSELPDPASSLGASECSASLFSESAVS